jgi:hypothetical protein
METKNALSPETYELAASIWPKASFLARHGAEKGEQAWREYVQVWFPKLESMNKILARAK